MSLHLFAGMRVRDFAEARRWYTKLLGDAWVAEISARGVEPDERETYSNGVRKIIYRDPDGNEIGFGGA